jgi:YggT family protein
VAVALGPLDSSFRHSDRFDDTGGGAFDHGLAAKVARQVGSRTCRLWGVGATWRSDTSFTGRRMLEFLGFISYLITLYTYVVIAVVIFSWLMAFGVINAYNPMVRSIWQALNAVTEPLLAPIRNAMPNMGGLDISPVILLLACYFIQTVVLPNIAKAVV